MVTLKFSDVLRKHSVIDLDELAKKVKMDKEKLEREIKNKIHRKYPIIYFDGTVITQTEKLSKKMTKEINNIITLEHINVSKVEKKQDTQEIEQEVLTKDDDELSEEEKRLREALKEIENL